MNKHNARSRDISDRMGPIGQGDIFFSGPTTATTQPISNLPCDGRTLYVQLQTFIGSQWLSPARYTYHACPRTLTVTPSAHEAGIEGESYGATPDVTEGKTGKWFAKAMLVLITFDRLDCLHMQSFTQPNDHCTLVRRGFRYRSSPDEGVIPPRRRLPRQNIGGFNPGLRRRFAC